MTSVIAGSRVPALGGEVGCLIPATVAAALAYKVGAGPVCGGLDLLLPFLPFPFHMTIMKSPSVGRGVSGASAVSFLLGLLTSFDMVFAGVDLCCASGCLAGGGMDFFSNASRRSSIFVSTDAVRAAASGYIGGIGTGPSVGCLCPLPSVPVLVLPRLGSKP